MFRGQRGAGKIIGRRSLVDASGFVSIFSVLIIMTILTLLVIGFSTTIRQAQKRALDNQLAGEAYYAAESGIATAKAIWKMGALGTKTNCDFNGWFAGADVIDTDRPELAVTCILADPTPQKLRYDNVGTNGMSTALERSGAVAITVLNISWDSTLSTDPFSGNTLNGLNNPIWETGTSWGNKVSPIKVDLTPGPYNDIPERDHNAQNSYVFYLYPSGNGTTGTITVSNTPLNQGQTVVGKCSAVPNADNYRCEANVTLNPGFLYTYAHIVPLYNPVKIQFSAKDGSGAAVSFKGAQVVVDATGRANDVYKRLQVRLSDDIPGQHIPYSLVSADTFCKRYVGIPGQSFVDGSVSAVPECQAN